MVALGLRLGSRTGPVGRTNGSPAAEFPDQYARPRARPPGFSDQLYARARACAKPAYIGTRCARVRAKASDIEIGT